MTWDDRYEYLLKACGGKLNPETLIGFQRAMQEYEVFMHGLRQLLAPVDKPVDKGDER